MRDWISLRSFLAFSVEFELGFVSLGRVSVRTFIFLRGLSFFVIWLLNTRASRSEFEARRLAPWTPV